MVCLETNFQLDGNKQTWPSIELTSAPAEVGGVRTEVGVERKLHSTFVWSEKSIKLLSCELHGKERPRNTHRGSLVIMLSFYNSRECEQLPMGKVKRAKREGRFFFFYCKAYWRYTVHLFAIWDWQHKICMLIHMLSLFRYEYLTLQPQWGYNVRLYIL